MPFRNFFKRCEFLNHFDERKTILARRIVERYYNKDSWTLKYFREGSLFDPPFLRFFAYDEVAVFKWHEGLDAYSLAEFDLERLAREAVELAIYLIKFDPRPEPEGKYYEYKEEE